MPWRDLIAFPTIGSVSTGTERRAHAREHGRDWNVKHTVTQHAVFAENPAAPRGSTPARCLTPHDVRRTFISPTPHDSVFQLGR